MAFSAVNVEKFGGLNLVSDPQETGMEQASSLINVALDRNGRLRTRDGLSTAYNSTLANTAPLTMHPVSGTMILAAFAGNSVKAVDVNAGTSTASVASATAVTASFASAGATGTVYLTDSTTTQIRKYTGGVFSSPAGLAAYKGNYLAVQPLDDRLVIADASATSKLWFSDAATPETITSSNFVQVTPGDGQPITGMAVFGTQLFVFKQTKFFVFYGNSTDATGNPVFNYRMMDTGVGCSLPSSIAGGMPTPGVKLTATHQTGVYFIGTDGVYRTTGGEPVKVSGAIDPVFSGTNLPVPVPFSSVLPAPMDFIYNLSIASDKLFLIGANSQAPTYVQFAMDLTTGEWTAMNLNAAGSLLDGDLAGFAGENIVGLLNAGSQGVVARMGKAFTADNGTAITWHHQSGFYDMGLPGQVKATRWTRLWGSGTPTVSMYTDMGTAAQNTGTVTLGTAPAVSEGFYNAATQGRLLSHRLSGSGVVTVHRLQHDLMGVRA